MAQMPDDFMDFIITSPPYDEIRKYNGYSFQFQEIAEELLRVLKKEG